MKKIQILTFLFAIFAFAICTKGFPKYHHVKRKKQTHNLVQLDLQSQQNRLLSNQQPQKIRITYDMSALNSIQNKETKNFIEKNIKTAIQFYSDMVKVKYPLTNPFRIPKDSMNCKGYYTYSGQQKQMLFKDTDLHILVSFVDNPDQSYLAYALSCISDQTGRPVLGLVNFNIGHLTSFSDYDFDFSLITTKHELFHVIAFDIYLYENFEISKGVKYPEEDYSQGYLRFPEVQKWARNHYNCQNLEGMPLENEGSASSFGYHWEQSLLYGETMTSGSDEGFWSDLNNALMQDSGWYEVDRSYHDIITYGKNQGCDFVYNQCKVKQYKEFCSKLGGRGPSISYHAAAVCSNKDRFTNGCYMMKPKKICVNPLNKDKIKYQEYQEYFGYNSRVFYSSLAPLSKNTEEQLMCYKYECVGEFQINVYFGNKILKCQTNFEKINSPDTNFKGYLKCPDIKDFCSKQQNYSQYCSQKGYCIKGECACLDGYSGPGCQCPPNQLFDVKTQTCNNCADEINCSHCDSQNSSICFECKKGFFLKDGQCQQCSDPCKVCSQSADNCISCLSGFNLIQNKCFPCPTQCETCSGDNSSTCLNCINGIGFDDQNNCIVKCSSNCKTCRIQADTCLTCQEGMYLQDNKCVCEDGTYFDSESNSCKQCPYLCKKCQNGNSCELCVETYSIDPKTKNCLRCQDQFFENSEGKCQKCHFSCQKCIDSTACTQCYEDSTLNSQNKCQCKIKNHYMLDDSFCVPCDESCAECTGSQPTQCKSCSDNLYFNNIDQTCGKCEKGYFLREQDQTCQKCDSKCQTCKDNADECITISCKIGQYNSSSKTCKDCNASCETCTSANECQECKSGYELNSSKQCVSE